MPPEVISTMVAVGSMSDADQRRIAELEAEVERLRAELAKARS
jgi:uncharacterized small protein (DUF1192 family)